MLLTCFNGGYQLAEGICCIWEKQSWKANAVEALRDFVALLWCLLVSLLSLLCSLPEPV